MIMSDLTSYQQGSKRRLQGLKVLMNSDNLKSIFSLYHILVNSFIFECCDAFITVLDIACNLQKLLYFFNEEKTIDVNVPHYFCEKFKANKI